jgi:hypothetical protein
MRLISIIIILLASWAASAVFIYLIRIGYPFANPALLSFLTSNRIPYSGELGWAFWTSLPCVFSLVSATGIGWIVNWAIGRIARRSAESHKGSDPVSGGG